MAHTRKMAVEGDIGVLDPVAARSRDELQAISDSINAHPFEVQGFTNPLSKPLTKTAKEILDLCDQSLKDNKISPYDALVKAVARARYADKVYDHGGRVDDSRTFYKTIADKTGTSIFPGESGHAQTFDEAVELALINYKLEKDAAFQKEYRLFKEKMKIDSKNMSDIITMLSTLISPHEQDPHFSQGLALLSDTLMRMMYTFSKDNLELYRQDFLKAFRALYPGLESKEIEDKVDGFLKHHIQMMTSLEGDFKKLYLDLAVNTCALGLQAAAPGITSAVSPLIGQGVTNLVSNATFGTVQASTLAGSVPSSTVGLAAKDLKTLADHGPSPIREPQRSPTASETYLRYREEKPKQMAVLGASVAVGLLTGPVGGIIVGIVGGAMLYGPKFIETRKQLKTIEEHENKEKEVHQLQCNQFFSTMPASQQTSTTGMMKTLSTSAPKPPQVTIHTAEALTPQAEEKAKAQPSSPSTAPKEELKKNQTLPHHYLPLRRF